MQGNKEGNHYNKWIDLQGNGSKWSILAKPELTSTGREYIEYSQSFPEKIYEHEWDEIDRCSKTMGKEWELDLNSPEKIETLVSKLTHLIRKRRKSKKEKKWSSYVGRLAATDTSDLPFIMTEEEDNSIPVNPSMTLWIGALEVLGYLDKPETPICYKDTIFPITAAGQTASSSNITGMEEGRYLAEKILTEGEQGAHDNCSWAIQNSLGTADKVDSWLDSIKAVWENNKRSSEQNSFLATTIRLAKTPPQDLPGWNGEALPFNTVSIVWTVSNEMYGSLWNFVEPKPRRKEDMIQGEDPDLNMNTQNKINNITSSPTKTLQRSILKSNDANVTPSPPKKPRTNTATLDKKASFVKNPYSNNYTKNKTIHNEDGKKKTKEKTQRNPF